MQMVREFDTDKNGSISMEEFILAVQLYAARSVSTEDDQGYTCLFIDYGPKISKRVMVVPSVCVWLCIYIHMYTVGTLTETCIYYANL